MFSSGITLSGTSTVVLSDSVDMVSGEKYTFLFTDGSGNYGLKAFWGGSRYEGGRAYLEGSFNSDSDLLFTIEIADSSTATQIALTGPSTVLKDGLGAFTITALDESDQPADVTENTTFSLSSDSSGDTFYSDPAGTTAITSATIPIGSGSVAFYGRDTALRYADPHRQPNQRYGTG